MKSPAEKTYLPTALVCFAIGLLILLIPSPVLSAYRNLAFYLWLAVGSVIFLALQLKLGWAFASSGRPGFNRKDHPAWFWSVISAYVIGTIIAIFLALKEASRVWA